VVKLVILPFIVQAALYTPPTVAGAWMGLAVKTDGAAVASGAITAALIQAKAANVLHLFDYAAGRAVEPREQGVS